jgi:hypothetical protein
MSSTFDTILTDIAVCKICLCILLVKYSACVSGILLHDVYHMVKQTFLPKFSKGCLIVKMEKNF